MQSTSFNAVSYNIQGKSTDQSPPGNYDVIALQESNEPIHKQFKAKLPHHQELFASHYLSETKECLALFINKNKFHEISREAWYFDGRTFLFAKVQDKATGRKGIIANLHIPSRLDQARGDALTKVFLDTITKNSFKPAFTIILGELSQDAQKDEARINILKSHGYVPMEPKTAHAFIKTNLSVEARAEDTHNHAQTAVAIELQNNSSSIPPESSEAAPVISTTETPESLIEAAASTSSSSTEKSNPSEKPRKPSKEHWCISTLLWLPRTIGRCFYSIFKWLGSWYKK